MQYLDKTLIACGILVLAAIGFTMLFAVSPKEACLRAGGTAVEFKGELVRCIEP